MEPPAANYFRAISRCDDSAMAGGWEGGAAVREKMLMSPTHSAVRIGPSQAPPLPNEY